MTQYYILAISLLTLYAVSITWIVITLAIALRATESKLATRRAFEDKQVRDMMMPKVRRTNVEMTACIGQRSFGETRGAE